jgi:hypothetical protein
MGTAPNPISAAMAEPLRPAAVPEHGQEQHGPLAQIHGQDAGALKEALLDGYPRLRVLLEDLVQSQERRQAGGPLGGVADLHGPPRRAKAAHHVSEGRHAEGVHLVNIREVDHHRALGIDRRLEAAGGLHGAVSGQWILQRDDMFRGRGHGASLGTSPGTRREAILAGPVDGSQSGSRRWEICARVPGGPRRRNAGAFLAGPVSDGYFRSFPPCGRG